MHNAFAVGSVEGISNFNGQGQDGLSLHRSSGDAVFQSQPIQKLHSDKALALVLADFVDSADVGMVQGRSRAGFAAKSFQCLRILRDILRQELERYKSAKGGVLGLINHTHAAAAEHLDDAVMRNRMADH